MIMQDTTFAFAGDCSLINISLFHFSVSVLYIYFFYSPNPAYILAISLVTFGDDDIV